MSFTLKSRSNGATDPPYYPAGLDATKTYFVDIYGEPCFAVGDDAFDLACTLTKPQIELYLSDRASRGINIIWWAPVDNVYSPSPPANANGDSPFTSGNFQNFNTSYWNYVDYVMQRCLAYGITVMFNPAFIGLNNGVDGWGSAFYGQTDAVVQGYASFLGARYGSFRNLIWLIGGDADPNNAASYAKLNTFAVALKAADPGHLMTMEATRILEAGGFAPNLGYSSVEAHMIAYGSVQPWLDVNGVYQTVDSCVSGAQRCFRQANLPNLLIEDGYELETSHSITMTALLTRSEGYGAVLGGCTLGRLFGNGAIWPFNSPHNNTVGIGPPYWQDQLSSQGSIGQQLLGRLFRSRLHHLLVPDTSNATMTVGAASGSVCARTSDAKTIIAYLPSSQTITINMSKITDGTNLASCNWFNPQTGAVTNIGNLANSGTHNFTSPDSNDWVLVIDSAAAALRTPGS